MSKNSRSIGVLEADSVERLGREAFKCELALIYEFERVNKLIGTSCSVYLMEGYDLCWDSGLGHVGIKMNDGEGRRFTSVCHAFTYAPYAVQELHRLCAKMSSVDPFETAKMPSATDVIKCYSRVRRPWRVGVVGYTYFPDGFDVIKAHRLLDSAIVDLALAHRDGCEVVSGLTNLGIPSLAYATGYGIGLETTGIACSLANDMPCYPVGRKIIVGDSWGDESDTFLEYIDELIKVGGGDQSEREFDAFKGPKICLM